MKKRKLFSCSEIILPALLIAVFMLQTLLFDVWLGIYSKTSFLILLSFAFILGVVLYGPALLLRKTKLRIYLLITSFLVSFVFIAQFLYYEYSSGFLQFSAVKSLGAVPALAGTIAILITPKLLLFLLGVFIVLISFFIKPNKENAEASSLRFKKNIIFTEILAVSFLAAFLFIPYVKASGCDRLAYNCNLKLMVQETGIINFSIADTIKHALKNDTVLKADKDFLQSWARKIGANKPSVGAKYFGAAKGKNLIIIQVESLENAVINKKIGGQEITPNLNRLASNGLYFSNYYTQVGPGNTADAEFSTMNTLYPLPDDVVFIDYAKNKYEALPKILNENGYNIYSLHGDVLTFWNRSNIYPNLGYQKSFGLDNYAVKRLGCPGTSNLCDEDLFSQSLPRIEDFKQPFLATLITMSSHTPFILADDLKTLKTPNESSFSWIQAEYIQSIHYTDAQIGKFIDGLKKDGLYNNSLILIWGDHGSFTGISDALGQKSILPSLNNSNVPMIILAPGTELSGTVKIPGSHLDVYPTIANLLGITPPKSILGQDLLNTNAPVETHFRLISGGVDAILTDNLAYQASDDGVFENGQCKAVPSMETLPVLECQNLYNAQSDAVRASDIIIRGNLLDFFSANLH